MTAMEGVRLTMYSDISTTVMATAVLMGFAKAESTTSRGSISDLAGVAGFARAAADTMQMILNPSTPAARTVNGAEYLRITKSVSLCLGHVGDRFCTAATPV